MQLPRILVVDDEPGVQAVLTRALRPQYEVFTAANGQAAIACARHTPPDLILLDVHLPDLDGYAVMQRLGEDPALAQIPIVVMTGDIIPKGDATPGDQVAHLAKPFTLSTLRQTVAALLAEVVPTA